jgi:hypothetical protein
MKPHPYLTQDQFADPMFIRIRRRVWLILLPYCTGEQRTEAERLIAVYDDILAR